MSIKEPQAWFPRCDHVRPHRAPAQKGPTLGLMLCCHCLKILHKYLTRGPHFQSPLSPANQIAGPRQHLLDQDKNLSVISYTRGTQAQEWGEHSGHPPFGSGKSPPLWLGRNILQIAQIFSLSSSPYLLLKNQRQTRCRGEKRMVRVGWWV